MKALKAKRLSFEELTVFVDENNTAKEGILIIAQNQNGCIFFYVEK